mgnify:FL=1
MKLSKIYEQRKNLIIDSLIEHGIYKFSDYGHLYEVPLKELEEKLKEITGNHTEA